MVKQNSDIHLGLTTEQKEALQKKAESRGLNLTAYCRVVLIDSLSNGKIIKSEKP